MQQAALAMHLMHSCCEVPHNIAAQARCLVLPTSLLCGGLQVKQLLESARDPDALLTALPSLMEPRTLISVLVTVKKW